jgi:hypothetical protein
MAILVRRLSFTCLPLELVHHDVCQQSGIRSRLYFQRIKLTEMEEKPSVDTAGASVMSF